MFRQTVATLGNSSEKAYREGYFRYMKIAVLVSGGVDSSVALRLLKDEGHELTAFYLKIWLEDELSFLGECPWEDDLAYVRAVCEQAGVPLYRKRSERGPDPQSRCAL